VAHTPTTEVIKRVRNPSPAANETSAAKTARLVAELVARNLVIDADILQDGSDQRREKAVRAIMDGNLCRNLEDESGLFMPADDVKELIMIFRALNAGHFWDNQEKMERFWRSKGVQLYDLCRTNMANDQGVWVCVNSLPVWPRGLVDLQIFARIGRFTVLATTMQWLIWAARTVLRSPNGARRYLVGAELYFNTLTLNIPAGVGPGITAGEFVFPTERLPYLLHILGLEDIDLCGEDATTVVDAAARKQLQFILVLSTNMVESEFVRVAPNNLRRNTVPIDPDVVRQRPPWRRAALTAPAAPGLASDGVQHPMGQASTPPPSPSTPVQRALEKTRFAEPEDDVPNSTATGITTSARNDNNTTTTVWC
jgi:hypothetical protein